MTLASAQTDRLNKPSDKFSKQYDVADDELVVTLIGQKTEMRLVLNWQQARELAAELTASEDAAISIEP